MLGRAPPPRPELDPQQAEVVFAPVGRALVIAGAGSGKTRAITYRVARLLAEGTPPDRILLATFTNRAANEMLRRVAELSGIDGRAMWAGTFHSVALRILRRHGGLLGLGDRFGILDRHDARELCGRCLEEEGAKRMPSPALLQSLLSHAAGSSLTIERALSLHAPRFLDGAATVARIADRFAHKKAAMSLLDFDDLLVLWKLLLCDHPEARHDLEERFAHVLVDEYQDVSPLQAELMERCAARHGSLMVVGDDAQSIYRFRGADLGLLLDFPRRFPDAGRYRLETNYRSTPEIVALANRSIGHNLHQHPKTLRAVRPTGRPPAQVILDDAEAQAEFVVDRALERVAAGGRLSDIAVLYRSHAHAVELELALKRRRVPHVVRSGPRFFEQAHVKDAVAFLRVVDNPRDQLAWSRLLGLWPGIGRSAERTLLAKVATDGAGGLTDPATVRALPAATRASVARLADLLDDLAATASEHGPQAVLQEIVARAYRAVAARVFPDDAEARLDDLSRLARYAARSATVAAFLADLALVASVGAEGVTPIASDLGQLTLSTVHQAKGLEWSTVFVVWLADGYFPPAVTLAGSPEEEEERRLFYVAATRAKDELFLCLPEFVAALEGVRTRQLRSRFLVEIEAGA